MYCNNCRIRLSDNVKFCPNCGMAAVPILEVAAEPETPEASPALNPQQAAEPFKAPEPFDPILDMPQPTAPMYTPVSAVAADPPAVYSDPSFSSPGYDPNGYAERPIVPAEIVSSIFKYGLMGAIFADTFFLSFLGIIFGAMARKKSNEMLAAYGYQPGKARAGRILGIVGIALGIALTVLLLFYVIFYSAMFAYLFSSGSW